MERYKILQLQHRHICDMVSLYLGIEPNEVLEGVADDNNYVDLLERFVTEGGKSAIMFYYQDGEPPELSEILFLE